ncbi:hypothetical protein KsCSTR_43790 [Candidatus Kuenenia stuttgartiensis]|uniref:Uncharacterized protein n=1 Tax=Kuenenia stuttgartiensis TaxID=174633 RepID=Q1PX05_KUEST|nr:hypothetical protein KsCSTR_43790 [Candidatus Kuenenia stuttgartiensis]CAJ71758.1 unknown protein [Candidatus Kuenenia stuttgartiensis]
MYQHFHYVFAMRLYKNIKIPKRQGEKCSACSYRKYIFIAFIALTKPWLLRIKYLRIMKFRRRMLHYLFLESGKIFKTM